MEIADFTEGRPNRPRQSREFLMSFQFLSRCDPSCDRQKSGSNLGLLLQMKPNLWSQTRDDSLLAAKILFLLGRDLKD